MPPAHLLLIEDDLDILSLLRSELEEAGYRVSSASSVMQGLTQAREDAPDLIVTDLGLPDGDGRDIVTRLRRDRQTPIVVLTARDDVSEKVELLGLGADDYLVKPCELQELLARIAVQLRAPASDVLEIGPLTLRPSEHLATLDGQDLRLSLKELALLALLMKQPGRVYSREDMVHAVWQGELADTSNVIDVHMANLREKFRQRGLPGLLRNVRGFGYALKIDRLQG